MANQERGDKAESPALLVQVVLAGFVVGTLFLQVRRSATCLAAGRCPGPVLACLPALARCCHPPSRTARVLSLYCCCSPPADRSQPGQCLEVLGGQLHLRWGFENVCVCVCVFCVLCSVFFVLHITQPSFPRSCARSPSYPPHSRDAGLHLAAADGHRVCTQAVSAAGWLLGGCPAAQLCPRWGKQCSDTSSPAAHSSNQARAICLLARLFAAGRL